MQSSNQPVLRDLVLVGGGHSHVGVLRMFAMKPEPGVRITLICTDIDTPYSGMLPGYISGHYSFDEVHIDLGRLCAFAGARLFHTGVIGIDRKAQKVICNNRPPVPYDLLSINIGSTPQMRHVDGAQALAVPVKPIAQFNQRWLALMDKARQWPAHRGPMTIAVVGAGAGGVELVLSMQYRLRNEFKALLRNPEDLQFVLLTSGEHILPTHNPGVRARFAKVLLERKVVVHTHAEVVQVSPGCLHTHDGRTFDADETMWVTQAGGPDWLQSTGLALDKKGFILVHPQLQSLNDPLVFAAGDIASFMERPLEKAGVFAVRMAKPLAENLRRSLRGDKLLAYEPQRHWLALISTGNPFAVASRGSLSFAGAWVWRWKDRIDRAFMRRVTEFPDMPGLNGPPPTRGQRPRSRAGHGATAQGHSGERQGAQHSADADERRIFASHFGHRHALRRLRRQSRLKHLVPRFRQIATDGASGCADRPAFAGRRSRRARANGHGRGANRGLFPSVHRRPLSVWQSRGQPCFG
jgi:selenide,water dikinase